MTEVNKNIDNRKTKKTEILQKPGQSVPWHWYVPSCGEVRLPVSS